MSASARVIMGDEAVTFADLAAGDWFRFSADAMEAMRRAPRIKVGENEFVFAARPELRWLLSSERCGERVEVIPVQGHGEMVEYGERRGQ